MRHLRLALIALAAPALMAAPACLEARQGTRAGETTSDAGPDVGPDDTSDIAPCPDPAGAAITVTRRGLLSGQPSPAGYDAVFTATAGAVLLSAPGTTGANAPDDDEILRLRPGSGGPPEQLTFNAERDQIITAHGDAVLVDRGPPGEGRSVVLVTPSREVVLAVGQVIWLSSWGRGGAKPRWLGADLAAWTSCPDAPTGCQAITLQVYDGVSTATLREIPAARLTHRFYGPSVDGRVVVFAERADDPAATWDLVAWHADSREQRVVAAGLTLTAPPVVSEDAVFITTPDAVERVDLASGARTTVATGQCVVPAVDGGRALVVCRDAASDPAVPVALPLHGGVLSFYDGAALHLVDEGAGAIASARIRGPLIGWLAYDSPSAGCHDRDLGEVRLAHAHAPAATHVVGPVGIGCLCCGAYWPEPQIEVGDGFVVWNYASRPDPDAFSESAYLLGFALVEADPLDCPR